ncbi:hypothetical protein J2755_002123 [Methanohalophilus levihalophilus]|uniref:2TM domain-containing protein n=1 Tax=Methanohalophilus levihalophilus TaxID=1431282 RepID=UPI001AE54E31|nr:2TM domain-containing protein [Methanohalophilus levihalophilus]MBP2031175.1 hypothetical protein [Methanohalophilus levihalophilus]
MEEKDEKLLRAQKRVKEIKGFYLHLAIYSVIMLLLFFIDYSAGGGWWVQWPIIGWGIAVMIHGITISKFGKGWEDKKIKDIMEKEK